MALKIRKDGAWVDLIPDETGPSVTATAKYSISAGDTVSVNSDGTVSKIGEISTETLPPDTNGSPSNFSDSVLSPLYEGGRIVYVPTGNYFVICYTNWKTTVVKDYRLRVRTATVDASGNISYGTIYYVNQNEDGSTSGPYFVCNEFQLVYDPDVDKVLIIVYNTEDGKVYSKYVSSSDGTTLTLNTLTTLNNAHGSRLTLDYNKGIKKFLVGYWTGGDYSTYYLRLGTAAADGNSVSWSDEIGITSYNAEDAGNHDPHSISLLANLTRGFLMTYERSTTNGTGSTTQTKKHAFARAIDVNGTTVTVGEEVQLTTGAYHVNDDGSMMLSFHEEENKFVLMYRQNITSPSPVYTLVMRIDNTYTGVSVGTANNLYTTSYGHIDYYGSFVYDPYVKDIYAYWTDYTVSWDVDKPLMVNKLILNDSELQVQSLGTKYAVYNADIRNSNWARIGEYGELAAVGHTAHRQGNGMSRFVAAGKTHHISVFQWQVGGYMAGGAAKAVGIQTTGPCNLTTTNFIGLSKDNYAHNDIATINTIASVDTNQSGLTIGQKYYVQNNSADISTTPATPKVEAGVALSPTNLLVSGGAVLTSEKIYPSPFSTPGWDI